MESIWNLKQAPKKISDTQCFMEIADGGGINVYYDDKIISERTIEVCFLKLYEELSQGKKRVMILTNDFNLFLDYFSRQCDSGLKSVIKPHCYCIINTNKIVSLQVYNCFVIRSTKYVFGSDSFSAAAVLAQIKKHKAYNDPKLGYTHYLGEQLHAEEIKKIYRPNLLTLKLIQDMPQGPIILTSNLTYEKVWSYDYDSAYSAIILENKFPKSYKKVDKPVEGGNLVRVRLTGVKAKYFNQYPMFRGKRVPPRDKVKMIGKRIIEAEEIELYIFLENEIPIYYYFYDIQKIEFLEIYEIVWFSLPDTVINAVKELWDEKEKLKDIKRRTGIEPPNYKAVKQTLNRIYGYFATLVDGGKRPRDPSIPWDVGAYIVSRQRYLMFLFIKEVGIGHVVSAHTDGIKVDFDAQEIVDRINEKRGILHGTCGKLEFEGILEKVQYLANTKAKYIENGELKMKHGGISEDDINEFISTHSWEQIRRDTIINITTKKWLELDENKVLQLRKKKTSMMLSLVGVEEENKYE